MVFSFFYNSLLFFYVLAFLPKALYEFFFSKKRRGIFHRFFIPKELFEPCQDKEVFWIHAVSVGEVKAAKPLIEKLKERAPSCFIFLSTMTDTGREEAFRINPKADCVLFLFFDFSWIMRKLFSHVQPKALFLTETDFWYHFLLYAKRVKTKIFLISGKLSDRSWRRFSFFSFFSKKLFSLFDLFCLQEEEYRKRFSDLGIEQERLVVTGNLKWDNAPYKLPKQELVEWKKILGKGPWVTIASTHAPEEKFLLKIFSSLKKRALSPKIFLAPRHRERCPSLISLLKEQKIPFVMLSDLLEKRKLEQESLLLVDKMGFLPFCYSLSDLAILGGSFIGNVGGHNILEPLFFKIPVFFGPFMFAQQELRNKVLGAYCGKEIALESLDAELLRFFQEENFRKELIENCPKIFPKKRIVEATWERIFPLL